MFMEERQKDIIRKVNQTGRILSIRNSGMLSDFGGLCKAGSKDVGKERIAAENTWRRHCS